MPENLLLNNEIDSSLAGQERLLLMEYYDRARMELKAEDEARLLGNSGVDQGYVMQIQETIDSITDVKQKGTAQLLLRDYEKETGRAADETKKQILLGRAAALAERELDEGQAGRIQEAVKAVTDDSERRKREAAKRVDFTKELLDMITEKDEKGKVKPMYTEFEQYQIAARVRLANKYAARQIKLLLGMIDKEEEIGLFGKKKEREKIEDGKEYETEEKDELPELDEDVITRAKIAGFNLDFEADADKLVKAAENGGFSAVEEQTTIKGSEAFDRFFKMHYPEKQKKELQQTKLDIFDVIYIGGQTARECFEHKYKDETPEQREGMMKCEVIAALVALKEHLSFSRIEQSEDGPMLTPPVDIRVRMQDSDSEHAKKLKEFQESETAAEYHKRMMRLSEPYARNIQRIFEWQAEEFGFGMTSADMHKAYERLHEERSMSQEKEEFREMLAKDPKKEAEKQKEKLTAAALEEEKEEKERTDTDMPDKECTNYEKLSKEELAETGRRIHTRRPHHPTRELVGSKTLGTDEKKEQKTPELGTKGMMGPAVKKKKTE